MSTAPRWTHPAPSADQASSLRVLAEASGRPAHAAGRIAPGGRAPRVVAIASGKGGVGKSNLAVNLCIWAARAGARTMLVDADMGLANADVLCGMTVGAHLGHVIDGVASLEDVAVDAPGGFRLVSGSSGVTRMAALDRAQRGRVFAAIRSLGGAADLVVIDCGAGIGATVLEALGHACLGLVITTPEPTAIADAYALIKAAVVRSRDTRGGRADAGIALVVNQVRRPREGRAVHERIDQVARTFLHARIAYAGAVREDGAIGAAVRARWPVALRSPRARSSRDIRALSGMILGCLDIRGNLSERPQGVVGPATSCVVPGAGRSGT